MDLNCINLDSVDGQKKRTEEIGSFYKQCNPWFKAKERNGAAAHVTHCSRSTVLASEAYKLSFRKD